jgi:hypothetical protein
MRRLVAFVLERRAASGAIDWKAALCETISIFPTWAALAVS